MRKGVLEVDSVNALMTQLSTINKKLEKLEASAAGTQEKSSKFSAGEEIKDSKGNITIKIPKILKDNNHSLQLNLLQNNQVTLKMP
ncbi:hypothetical protein PIB30_040753 [Stylosanthes scabra]|uniref:Uncharacterized protein n=1 Tax=Stylosanthes scabra TaxID=79078 RepID=A0ABU6XFY4_9FABA|nr:hypothetical protein [Stylosanthes scabra]